MNEAKELVVREGKRLTLSKLGKLINLRLLSIKINVIVFSREEILQNIKFSLTYLYKTKQFYPCEPAPIYFPAIYGTDLDCVTTQVERFGGKILAAKLLFSATNYDIYNNQTLSTLNIVL